MSFETWLGRASLGRINGDEFDDMGTSVELTKIWVYILTEAGYEPTGFLADYYWSEGFPEGYIKQKATTRAETLTDIGQYFDHGAIDPSLRRLEETAYDNGIESAVEAYFSGVPLEDIIA